VLVVHSDAGSQYPAYDYAQVIDDHERPRGVVRGQLQDPELIRDCSWPSGPAWSSRSSSYLGWSDHARLHGSRGDIHL
jgi:hypothetical protein